MAFWIHDGGDEGDRTPDLLTASQALSQLSYAPVRRSTIRELGPRCKDNFGKTFWGARGHASGDRDAPHRPPIRGPSGASPPAPWDARRETGPSTTSGRPPPRRPATKPAHLLPLGGTARPHRRLQNENCRQTACSFRETRGVVEGSGQKVVDAPLSWRRHFELLIQGASEREKRPSSNRFAANCT